MAIIIEKFDSREASVWIDSPSVDLQVMVLGTELDTEVRALVQATLNNAPFKGFARGEVLFLGASGSQRGTEDWEIAFKFAASPNAMYLKVDEITGIEKKGCEYLWVTSS